MDKLWWHMFQLNRSNAFVLKKFSISFTFVMNWFAEKTIADIVSFTFTGKISIGVGTDGMRMAWRLNTFVDILKRERKE